MRNAHRAAFWSVAGAHLAAAALTWYAGVPIASPIALALGGLVAIALGFRRAEAARTDDAGHPLLGRSAPVAPRPEARAAWRRRDLVSTGEISSD